VSDSERIGVFGGTFDPIHYAHLDIARTAMKQAHLDQVVFVVSARPPHKRKGPFASPEDRYAMVEAAVAVESRMTASRTELDRGGPSYTVDTLEYIAAVIGPEAEIFFITGADAVLDILTWKAPARVLELCTLIAATRPGYDLSRQQDPGPRQGRRASVGRQEPRAAAAVEREDERPGVLGAWCRT